MCSYACMHASVCYAYMQEACNFQPLQSVRFLVNRIHFELCVYVHFTLTSTGYGFKSLVLLYPAVCFGFSY